MRTKGRDDGIKAMKTGSRVLIAIAATWLGGLALPTADRASAADLAFYPAQLEPAPPGWWYHYYVEAGVREFLNNPQRDGVTALGGQSLAKYYEYSTIKPGAFLDGWTSIGSNNGLYQIDGWAKNIGYSDQKYELGASVAGRHYVSFSWDQIPHVYSTSAQTIYNGVGSTNLTLPPGLSNQLFGDAGCTPGPAGCIVPVTPANAAKVQQDILTSTHQTDIGIRRDTASVEYRYTPDDHWDWRANYSNTRRTGTQPDAVLFAQSTVGVRVDVPKPVADTTQNYGASGEYAGVSAWNQKFNLKVAYNGSTYTDDASSYTVQNPFCPIGAVNPVCANGFGATAPVALMSSWPSNQANGASTTAGVDLPFNSRYMGTVSYTNMRQNQQFQPFTLTPFTTTGGVPAGWSGIPGVPVNSLAALPTQSLNGNINTLLVNNVITTQLTPDLKVKTSYRFYNYDNGTPEIKFSDWVLNDAFNAKIFAFLAPVQSISVSYNKQNVGSEINWRPSREWNLGAMYGYERYDYIRTDVDTTRENSGKFYVDWKPAGWMTARASVLGSERRYDNYDYLAFVGIAQWPSGGASQYSTAYRQFMFDNRDRLRVQTSLAVDVFHNVTLTPTLSYRDDNYMLNRATEVGLNSDKAVSAGVELAWVASSGYKVRGVLHARPPGTADFFGWAECGSIPALGLLHRQRGRQHKHLHVGRHTRGHSIQAGFEPDLQLRHREKFTAADLCRRNGPECRHRRSVSGRDQHLPAARSNGEIHVRRRFHPTHGMERQGQRATALCLGEQPGHELANRPDADLYVLDHQYDGLHDLAGLEQPELQRAQDRRFAGLRVVGTRRRDTSIFRPSLIPSGGGPAQRQDGHHCRTMLLTVISSYLIQAPYWPPPGASV